MIARGSTAIIDIEEGRLIMWTHPDWRTDSWEIKCPTACAGEIVLVLETVQRSSTPTPAAKILASGGRVGWICEQYLKVI